MFTETLRIVPSSMNTSRVVKSGSAIAERKLLLEPPTSFSKSDGSRRPDADAN